MKKLLLSALAVCAFTFSNAQEEKTEGTSGYAKGDMMISGAFSIDSQSNVGGAKDVKTSSFEIAPKFGFFVSDNIAVGAKIGFMQENGENAAGDDTMDKQTLSVGAFGRYYFTPASKFSVFGELGLDYNSIDNKLNDAKWNGIDAMVSPGISYFVSNSFAIEASWGALQFETEKGDWDNAETDTTFGLGLDLRDLTFGLVYKF